MEDDSYIHFEFQTTDKGIDDLMRLELMKPYLIIKLKNTLQHMLFIQEISKIQLVNIIVV